MWNDANTKSEGGILGPPPEPQRPERPECTKRGFDFRLTNPIMPIAQLDQLSVSAYIFRNRGLLEPLVQPSGAQSSD